MKCYLIVLSVLIGCQTELKPPTSSNQDADESLNILKKQIHRNMDILDKIFLRNHTVINIENEKAPLKDIIQDEILLLRIPFVSCQVCREQEINYLKDVFPIKTPKIALVISAERNRDFYLFNRINQIDQDVYRFPPNELFAEWDQFGKPYAILIDAQLKIIGVHFPLLEFSEFSEEFYKTIAKRFEKNLWDIHKNLQEQLSLKGSVIQTSKFWKETFGRGTIKDKNIYEISAPVNGYLKKWHFKEGQYINRGVLLAEFTLESIESKLLQSKFNLERTKAAFEKRLIQLGYLLSDSTKIPNSIWESAKLNSGYSESLAQAAQIQKQIQKTRIISPIQGNIKTTLIKPGQRVQIGQPIVKIATDHQKYIQFNLLKYQAEKIQIGNQLVLTNYPNISGTITQIGSEVKEDGTLTLGANLSSNNLLRGEKVNFKILTDVQEGISIPRTSLLQKNGKFSVYTFNKRPILKEIIIADGNEEFVLVKKGLSVGDTIIKNPKGYLDDFQNVKLNF